MEHRGEEHVKGRSEEDLASVRTDLMQPCFVWLLSCSWGAHAISVRPRDVKIRGIAAPVRIYEAESQDAALDAAIETDSDPFGACCWPSAVVAARSIAARDGVAGLRILELGAGTGLASAAAARLGADVVATDVSDISLELLRRAAAEAAAFDVQRLDFTDATAVAALGHFDVVVAADTLYEEAIARATARVVRASHGACIVVDPGRPDGRRAFLDELAGLGRFEPVVVSAEELSAFPLGAGLTIESLGVYER